MNYQDFAHYYDDLMSHVPYDKWADFTASVLAKYDMQANSIVDLGCGTGEITTRLADMAPLIYGVDLSADMLSVARAKYGQEITWIKQNIRELAGFENIDLMTSYLDVINYLTEREDVKHAFSLIYNALSDKGVFIFDIHHLAYVKKHLVNHTFADVTDQTSYIWFCDESERPYIIEHDLTFFSKSQSNYYKKESEYHEQLILPHESYLNMLTEAGFKEVNYYTDFNLESRFLTDDVDRIFIVAKK